MESTKGGGNWNVSWRLTLKNASKVEVEGAKQYTMYGIHPKR
jgi:hypothetical protein